MPILCDACDCESDSVEDMYERHALYLRNNPMFGPDLFIRSHGLCQNCYDAGDVCPVCGEYVKFVNTDHHPCLVQLLRFITREQEANA